MDIAFLTYHEIAHADSAYSYRLSVDLFEQHLRRAMDQSALRLSPIFTFDDGHESQFANALPLLQKYPRKAIFFVTASWIGKRQGYMEWSHLRELSAWGHQVQSHSLSHPMLTHCSGSELNHELSSSKKMIEDKLGSSIHAISIPNGRWDSRVADACIASGYTDMFTSDPWIREQHHAGLRILGRINVTRSMSASYLQSLLDCESTARRIYDFKSRAKRSARQLTGDYLYHKLWRAFSRADSSTP